MQVNVYLRVRCVLWKLQRFVKSTSKQVSNVLCIQHQEVWEILIILSVVVALNGESEREFSLAFQTVNIYIDTQAQSTITWTLY